MATASALLLLASPAMAVPIQVEIENLTSQGGLYFTPVWVGLHDGSYDLFDAGVAAPAGGALERLAEDGNAADLQSEFSASAAGLNGGIQGVITAPAGFAGAPVFDPGDSASDSFDVDPVQNRYFSYASMVIPSNDAFIGNDNPMSHELFDGGGNFTGPITMTVYGRMIWDAGTEANTEMDAAFINQAAPNTGTTTSDPVDLHPGFIDSVGGPAGTPIILGGTTAAGTTVDPVAGDFTIQDYELARITITPEPVSLIMVLLGSAALVVTRRRSHA
jgi:hypothetical protein